MAGNYDRIARFYDVDMARNMPFDDVAFYAGVCRRSGGTVLELGCGTGRIFLPLLAGGIDAYGADASPGMLRELSERAAARGLAARVCLMDVRELGFRRSFDTVLCPYSLVTYLTADEDLDRAFAGIRSVLNPGGALVLDAFIPRPLTPTAEFKLDYRRPFGSQTLARWKRISGVAEGINRIERRYQVLDAADAVVEQIDIGEEIRPFSPIDLTALLTRQGFTLSEGRWDYAQQQPFATAQFFTAVAHVA